jgi:tRNA threonylcarbamoyl adenosine modification protein (Sua5/YciO/YrdC/YwlC family)
MAHYFSVHPVDPQPRLIGKAVALIGNGGVVAYPTDSSYAIGCRIGDVDAVRRIRRIRGVDEHHHLTLVCRDLHEIAHYARVDDRQFRILKRGTPGGYTFLLPASRELPRRLLHPKRRSIGIRVPEHRVAQALLAALGEPLLSSTLILPGHTEPMHEPEAIREALDHELDLIIDAGLCDDRPSTIVDLEQDPPVVLRAGRGDAARLGL